MTQNLKSEIKSRLRLEDQIAADGFLLKREGRNMVCCCPFHNENSPSFKIDIDGKFYKCFGCGASGDVLSWIASRINKTLDGDDFNEVLREGCKRAQIDFPSIDSKYSKQIAPRPTKPKKQPVKIYPTLARLRACVEYAATKDGGHVAAQYEYSNPKTGNPDLIVFRLEFPNGSKRFYQAIPTTGGFSFGGLKTPNPLFNRTALANSNTAIVVEGEKCVAALTALDIIATTSPAGSKSAAKADWTPLAGKIVAIWRDYDDSGKQYCKDVVTELEKLNPRPSISIVDVDGMNLQPGDDVVDFLAETPGDPNDKAFEFWNVIGAAKEIFTHSKLDAELEDAVAGLRFAVPFPWSIISQITNALQPGTVTLLCGGPGATKSLMLLQSLINWKRTGVNACALMLEDGQTYHLRRGMAQISKTSQVTVDAWCKSNPDKLRAIQNATRSELTALKFFIEEPDNMASLTVKILLDWIEAKCRDGCRVIAIDPITLMEKSNFGYQDDLKFMTGAKRIVEHHKASLLLITHPRKANPMSKSGIELSDIAGGAAYERFGQTILYLKAHSATEVFVTTAAGRIKETANRTLYVLKARNGLGTGERVAMHFDSGSLTASELGLIVTEAK